MGEGTFMNLYRVGGVTLCRAVSNAALKKAIELCKHAADEGIQTLAFSASRTVLLRTSGRQSLQSLSKLNAVISKLHSAKLLHQVLPAFSKTGNARSPMVFPNGVICILLKDSLSVTDKKALLGRTSAKPIKTYGRSPFLKVGFPRGRELDTSALVSRLEKNKLVEAVTPDFHYFGDFDPNPAMPPNTIPDVASDSTFQRAFVERAWEFGWGKDGTNVAVVDSNFYDHADITYRFDHGFDAADGDHDPRSPLNPPDVVTTNPLHYRHGTEMSGVIAGDGGVNPITSTGVSPISKIVPIRPAAPQVDPLQDAQAFLDSWVSQWIDAMIEIFLSGAPVINASIAIGINPEVIPDSWHAWLIWLNWSSSNGRGRFFAASAGNNEGQSPISFLARLNSTFAVGWADLAQDRPLGNVGPRLDISVPDGRWGAFWPNDQVLVMGPNSGGSSVACAVVSGTAAQIYAQGNWTSREVADIIRRTARHSPNYESTADSDGFSTQFGYGYLDAFAAVKQAHKGKVPAGRAVPIRFSSDGLTYTLVQQLGINPWFWCLVPKTDNMGSYWNHWRPNQPFGVDISSGINTPGPGLVVADFNGDGRDEIAVQQAGNRQNRFNIIRYSAAQDTWYRMGPSQDSRGSALVWGSATPTIVQVFGADVDGDGRAELIANRANRIDMAKFVGNQWGPFGPTAFTPTLFDPRMLPPTSLAILDVGPVALWLAPLRRNDLGRDVILASALVRVTLGMTINVFGFRIDVPLSTTVVSSCSLHRFEGGQWHIQVLDGWGTTHISVPFTHNILIVDIDGDGTDEVVLYLPGGQNQLVVLDFAEGFPASTSQHGYIKVISEWPGDGPPSELLAGDFNGNGKFELAYLDSTVDSDGVRFLEWDPALREWRTSGRSIRKQIGNRALQMAVADYDGDGVSEIALLLEKPFANTYHVFKRATTLQLIGEL